MERSMMDFKWSDDDDPVFTVFISDRKVPRSLGWEMAKCWDGCKDENTGDFTRVMPIIMTDKKYDYCPKCCTAWLTLRSIKGEIENE